MSPSRKTAWLTVALLFGVSAAAGAQRGGGFFAPASRQYENPRYNGKFTFTRLSYGGGGGLFRGGSSWWSHDYPQADMHLPLIIDALTSIEPNLNVSNIFSLEDPEIFKNPVLYMWEPGYWRPTEAGIENLRRYMLKGGFVIFDDFEQDHWINFEAQFRQAIPDAEFIPLDVLTSDLSLVLRDEQIDVPHPTMPACRLPTTACSRTTTRPAG